MVWTLLCDDCPCHDDDRWTIMQRTYTIPLNETLFAWNDRRQSHFKQKSLVKVHWTFSRKGNNWPIDINWKFRDDELRYWTFSMFRETLALSRIVVVIVNVMLAILCHRYSVVVHPCCFDCCSCLSFSAFISTLSVSHWHFWVLSSIT